MPRFVNSKYKDTSKIMFTYESVYGDVLGS